MSARSIEGSLAKHCAKTVADGFSEIRVAHFAVQITKVLFVFERNTCDRLQDTFHLKKVQGVHLNLVSR